MLQLWASCACLLVFNVAPIDPNKEIVAIFLHDVREHELFTLSTSVMQSHTHILGVCMWVPLRKLRLIYI